MKTYLFSTKFALVLFLILGTLTISAQTNPMQVLKGTSWKGIAMLPTEKQVVLKFGETKAEFIVNGKVAESMTYTTTKSNVITFTKVSGSICGEKSIGEYRYSVGPKGNLLFKMRDDNCTERILSFTQNEFTKSK